ncbi:MAG TPA: hypothetical protein VEQ85_13650, partial [Lacipirellulaceae bacterium]|nr:hypothetical protein [Lacipirellulaceae bacterium]
TRPASLTIQGLQAAPVGGPVRLSLERRAVAGKPVVRASLDSSAGVLPVWAVGAFVPALGAAGRGALFSGFVEWEQGAVHSRGAARGELRGVDLAKVFPANSPCRAEGHAQASLAQLQWSDGQVELLQGAIRAEDVRVSRSLLDAAATRLLCGVAPLGSGPPEELVPVAKLAARFEFRPQGITLWGDFPSVAQLPEGCLALGLTGALVLQPQHRLLPVGCWVQFAAGPSGNWMPATREGVQIASGLPLPPAETAHK